MILPRENNNVGIKMNMKKTSVMFNNCILNHEIKVQYEKCDQDYIFLGQKISASLDHETGNQKQNRDGIGCF